MIYSTPIRARLMSQPAANRPPTGNRSQQGYPSPIEHVQIGYKY